MKNIVRNLKNIKREKIRKKKEKKEIERLLNKVLDYQRELLKQMKERYE